MTQALIFHRRIRKIIEGHDYYIVEFRDGTEIAVPMNAIPADLGWTEGLVIKFQLTPSWQET